MFREEGEGRISKDRIKYLADDCTLFEGHLLAQESMVFQMYSCLKGWKVLNVGAPH